MMSGNSVKRFFDGQCVREIVRVVPSLLSQQEEFVAAVDAVVGPLEIKDRVMVIAQGLRDRLPDDYCEAVGLLVESLGPELREGEGMFTRSWYLMPVARFVEEFGVDYPEVSLPAIREITMRHTGEYAIRPYLRDHYEMTMGFVHDWSQDPSFNVRRLASEGIRPRLPWASRLLRFIDDPSPVVDVLNSMINDPSLYVRKSVANNLNDISRDNPDIAIDTARRWLASSASDRTAWIVGRGMRSLVGQGHPEALSVVGLQLDPDVRVSRASVSPVRLKIGDGLVVEAEIHNGSANQSSVNVDYRFIRHGPEGRSSQRSYKLAQITLEPGATTVLRKSHVLRDTRAWPLRPGAYTVTVLANGMRSEPVEFEVSAS